MTKKLFVLLTMMFFVAPAVFAAKYTVDVPHTQIHFSVAHLMVFKVRGSFTDFSGEIDIDTQNKTLTSASAVIKAESIAPATPSAMSTLRSPDFSKSTSILKFTSPVKDQRHWRRYYRYRRPDDQRGHERDYS